MMANHRLCVLTGSPHHRGVDKTVAGVYGYLSERFTTGLTQIRCTKDLVRELVDVFFQGGSYRKRKNPILEEA